MQTTIFILFYCNSTVIKKKKLLIWTNVYTVVSAEIKLPRHLASKQNNMKFSDINIRTNMYYVDTSIWIDSLAIMVLDTKCISWPKLIIYMEGKNYTESLF